jgi:cation diffusion facilitator CzcD-associated flavoprotein CzcO
LWERETYGRHPERGRAEQSSTEPNNLLLPFYPLSTTHDPPKLVYPTHMPAEHFDVIIIGAGLSGIGAAYRLLTQCPSKRYIILEARGAIGGTWDLFRYPGIRSDSDMYTLGYPFRPWKSPNAIADGASILQYICDTAREFDIDRHIRFQHRVVSASWSSGDSLWHLDVQSGENSEPAHFTSHFLYGCTGYYRYDSGYQPDYPGLSNFRGRFVHPQHWPEDLDYTGKRVVIIGSGATAVTIVPAVAGTTAHVTMLQRSPSYVLSLPANDPIANVLRRLLPHRVAHSIVRSKNILLSLGVFQLSRRSPNLTKRVFRSAAQRHLPKNYEIDRHFKPRYEPWDQRLCIAPDADIYRAIASGRASVVTDEIDTFTQSGIQLQSGKHLEADIVVSATGLQMLALGGVQLAVDGVPVDQPHSFVYKGTMLSNVPNFAFCVGYTNASWGLRADLASTFVCRLLNHMDRHGYRTCIPTCDTSSLDSKPLLDLTSGYIQRAAPNLPKQSSTKPWYIPQNYLIDVVLMKMRRIDDGILQFDIRPPHRDFQMVSS